MLNTIHDVLNQEQLAIFQKAFGELDFISGIVTSPGQSAEVKDNLQLSNEDPGIIPLRKIFFDALNSNPLFINYCMTLRIQTPMFSRYEAGMRYGKHIDAALIGVPNERPLRTDISCTLFLSDPESYEGGELIIELPSNEVKVKLPAGSLVLYSPHYAHEVAPVTKGVRYAAVTWVESMVANADHRQILFEMGNSISGLKEQHGLTTTDPAYLALSNCHQKLMREWTS